MRTHPVDDLLVLNLLATTAQLREKFDGVRAHELPHDCKNKFAVAVANVATADTNKFAAQLLCSRDSLVTVLDLLKFDLGILVHFLPVDTTWFDLLAHAQDVLCSAQVSVQIIDVVTVGSKNRVHPHAEYALLASAFAILQQRRGIKVLWRCKPAAQGRKHAIVNQRAPNQKFSQ